MKRFTFPLVIIISLAACGGETGSQGKQTIDVTPSNAQNIVQDTGAKVNSAVEQGKDAIDKAEAAANGGDKK
jgi:hypothetical protein